MTPRSDTARPARAEPRYGCSSNAAANAALLFSLAAATWLPVPSRADWPHWRGDHGNGASLTARPPVEFGGDTNCRWRVELPGRGSSSPIVAGERVFVTTAVPVPGEAGLFDFRLLCLDRDTGRERWSRSCGRAVPHEGTHQTNGFASASPCADDEQVYAFFGSRGLHCFTLDGEPRWSRDFGDMRIRAGFGEGASPTLAGEVIIVPWDHEGPSMLFAVDRRTGETVWETPRDEPTCWATPLVMTDCGRHDAGGHERPRMPPVATTSPPAGNSGGAGARPCGPVPLPWRPAARPSSAAASAARSWPPSTWPAAGISPVARRCCGRPIRTRPTSPPRCSPRAASIYYKEKSGLLTCVDAATGRPHWETARIPGVSRTYASPVAAAGHVYLTDRSGRITVIRDADVLEVAAENDVGEGVDATPALAGDSLFIRGERHLFRFAVE